MSERSPSAAKERAEFCGDTKPHERHEWVDGVLRRDCPGAPTLESMLAGGGEVPDVPVRPWVERLGAYLRIFGARGRLGGDSLYLDSLETMAKGKVPRGR